MSKILRSTRSKRSPRSLKIFKVRNIIIASLVIFAILIFILFIVNIAEGFAGVPFSGTELGNALKPNSDGTGWTFTPLKDRYGTVKLTYKLTDGKMTKDATAYLMVRNILRDIVGAGIRDDNPSIAKIDSIANFDVNKESGLLPVLKFNASDLIKMFNIKSPNFTDTQQSMAKFKVTIANVIIKSLAEPAGTYRTLTDTTNDTNFLANKVTLKAISSTNTQSDIVKLPSDISKNPPNTSGTKLEFDKALPRYWAIPESDTQFEFTIDSGYSKDFQLEMYFYVTDINYDKPISETNPLLYPASGWYKLFFRVPEQYREFDNPIPVFLGSFEQDSKDIVLDDSALIGSAKAYLNRKLSVYKDPLNPTNSITASVNQAITILSNVIQQTVVAVPFVDSKTIPTTATTYFVNVLISSVKQQNSDGTSSVIYNPGTITMTIGSTNIIGKLIAPNNWKFEGDVKVPASATTNFLIRCSEGTALEVWGGGESTRTRASFYCGRGGPEACMCPSGYSSFYTVAGKGVNDYSQCYPPWFDPTVWQQGNPGPVACTIGDNDYPCTCRNGKILSSDPKYCMTPPSLISPAKYLKITFDMDKSIIAYQQIL
jgi:hypothetical protein